LPAKLSLWRSLAVLLTAIELTLANAWLIVTAPADLWRQPSPAALSILGQRDAAVPASISPRIYRANLASWRPAPFGHSSSSERLAELARWERDTLFPKYELLSGVDLVETYSSIKLADYESLLVVAKERGPRQADKSFLPQPAALRLLGTEYLLLPGRQQPAFADRMKAETERLPEDAALWRMQRTLPRAWIVHDIETLPALRRPLGMAAIDSRSEQVLFPNLRARDFARTAVIEGDAELSFAEARSSASSAPELEDACEIAHYDPQRVVVSATLTRPGLVVLGDAWYSGWRARAETGGHIRPVTIYRTNRVLRGVWLNAGQHKIEFRFWPTSVYVGALVSGLSWLALACLWFSRGGWPRLSRTFAD
jgi:hypothetical protein